MFDCGARGRGNATSMGLLEQYPSDAPFATAEAIVEDRSVTLKVQYKTPRRRDGTT